MRYTDEEMAEIRRRICEQELITDWAERFGYTLKPTGQTIKLKGYNKIAIYPHTNTYCNFKEIGKGGKAGGNVIDFVAEFGGIDKKAAWKLLVDRIGGYDRILPKDYTQMPKPKATIKVPEKKPFELPPKGNTQSNVRAYLTKTRKIDKDIVDDLFERGMIYQDDRKNCVFVGHNKEKKAVFGCKRSSNTYKKFVGDLSGNDYNVCWYVDNGAKQLVVAESPIDIMSIMTIMKGKGKKLEEYNFLGLSGTPKITSAIHHVKEDGIEKVITGLDKDEAGISTGWRLNELLKEIDFKGEVTRYLPHNKDFNDDIVKDCVVGDTGYIVKDIESICDERYCNPIIAETLRKIDVPIGYIVDNSRYIEKNEPLETWYFPFKRDDDLQKKFFNENIVPVICPKFSTDEKVKEIVNTFEAIYRAGVLQELSKRLDTAKQTPSLDDIKKVAIYIHEKKNSILGKLKDYSENMSSTVKTEQKLVKKI